jgi:DNA/RNA endonuclease YhcR with UshA esterase domain
MRLPRNLFSAVGLALLVSTFVHAESISPRETPQHVGVPTTVEGVVSQVSRSSGGTTFINFGGRYPNHAFYAVVFRNRAYLFPDIFELEGKTVAVSGTIELYKGKLQIMLLSPDQIELQ